ncbi:MAG: coproporphyrinogen III oxidase, partial [Candidatus Paracaedibacteraceae bacterium]|nr:coproporphyrinogen III oxidase [Candidatus Paracaedibacteraceae bacterium]
TELMLMGLRLDNGIAVERFTEIMDQGPAQMFGVKWQSLLNDGLIQEKEKRILATDKGRLKLNGILEYLFG